jgi:hypothetical protein
VKGLCDPGREMEGDGSALWATKPGAQNSDTSIQTRNLRFEGSKRRSISSCEKSPII